MDPTATLNAIRLLVEDARAKENPTVLEHDLANAIEALDEWIMSGGFLPGEWKNNTGS